MLAYGFVVMMMMFGGDRDPAMIPWQERIAYVNKLADRLTGINANKDYTKALDSYVALYELSLKAPDDAARKAYDHVDSQLYVFTQAKQWSLEEATVIREWLKANDKTLKLLKKATKRKRYFHPLSPTGSRLHTAVLDPVSPGLMRLAKLCEVAANDHAIRGDWKGAYKWNLRIHTIADHTYQQPWSLLHMVGLAVERSACKQFLHFLQQHFPRNAGTLFGRIAKGDELRCSPRIFDQVEALWTRDHIEVWHEWAQNPKKHPDLTEIVEMWLDGDDLLEAKNEISGNSPFKNVTALRKALRASSVERDWKVSLRAEALMSKWCALPFHEAWKKVDEFEREYCDVLLTAPSLTVCGCGFLLSSQPRLLREETTMLCTAVSAVVAIHEFRDKNGRLPKQLDELVPEFLETVPIDPYSGRPYVYRTEKVGNNFTLYSVGSDQVDDRAKAA